MEPGTDLAKMLVARELSNADLGRQLHDGVSQVLSAAGLQLELLRMEAGDSPLAARISEVQRTLETAVNQVRSVSHELNPHTIERVGFSLTLRNLAREAAPAYTGTYEVHGPERFSLPRAEALALALCLVQTLGAVIQVAGARRIVLHCQESSEGLSLQVHAGGGKVDLQGRRCPALLLAKEYASSAGYNYSLETKPERDTIITVRRDNLEP